MLRTFSLTAESLSSPLKRSSLVITIPSADCGNDLNQSKILSSDGDNHEHLRLRKPLGQNKLGRNIRGTERRNTTAIDISPGRVDQSFYIPSSAFLLNSKDPKKSQSQLDFVGFCSPMLSRKYTDSSQTTCLTSPLSPDTRVKKFFPSIGNGHSSSASGAFGGVAERFGLRTGGAKSLLTGDRGVAPIRKSTKVVPDALSPIKEPGPTVPAGTVLIGKKAEKWRREDLRLGDPHLQKHQQLWKPLPKVPVRSRKRNFLQKSQSDPNIYHSLCDKDVLVANALVREAKNSFFLAKANGDRRPANRLTRLPKRREAKDIHPPDPVINNKVECCCPEPHQCSSGSNTTTSANAVETNSLASKQTNNTTIPPDEVLPVNSADKRHEINSPLATTPPPPPIPARLYRLHQKFQFAPVADEKLTTGVISPPMTPNGVYKAESINSTQPGPTFCFSPQPYSYLSRLFPPATVLSSREEVVGPNCTSFKPIGSSAGQQDDLVVGENLPFEAQKFDQLRYNRSRNVFGTNSTAENSTTGSCHNTDASAPVSVDKHPEFDKSLRPAPSSVVGQPPTIVSAATTAGLKAPEESQTANSSASGGSPVRG